MKNEKAVKKIEAERMDIHMHFTRVKICGRHSDI